MALSPKEYNIIKSALETDTLSPTQRARARALVDAQENSESGRDTLSNARIAAGNFAAGVLGLPGDLMALASGQDNPLTSENLAPGFGGNPDHISFLPSQLLAPGPGELKALGAMAGAAVTRKGLQTVKAKQLNKAFLKARKDEQSVVKVAEQIDARKALHPDDLLSNDMERMNEIANGAESAFEPIYKTYHPLVKSVAADTLRKHGFDDQFAEDVAQATWGKWIQKVRAGEVDFNVPIAAQFKAKEPNGIGRNLIMDEVRKETSAAQRGFGSAADRAKAEKTALSLDAERGDGLKMQDMLQDSGAARSKQGVNDDFLSTSNMPQLDAQRSEARSIMLEEIMQFSPTVQERLGPALRALATREFDNVTDAAEAYGLKAKTLRTHWKKVTERTNAVQTGKRARVPFKDRVQLSIDELDKPLDRIPAEMIPPSKDVAADMKRLEGIYKDLKKLDAALLDYDQRSAIPQGSINNLSYDREQRLARETYNKHTGRMNQQRQRLIKEGQELAAAIKKAGGGEAPKRRLPRPVAITGNFGDNMKYLRPKYRKAK